ncbi:MAG: DUF58 domain-containing protein [Bacteroidia bacterium]
METINFENIQKFTHLELIAKQVVEGFITGLHKSPFHGFSVEFAEHRIYNKGESTKHIDWKLFGRTDKLFIKRYEEETNLRCQIIIDNSSSMYFPLIDNVTFPSINKEHKINKIAFSVYCAAALIELLKRQRDAVGLSIFSEKIELHTPTKSNSLHHKFLYHELEKRLQNSNTINHTKTNVVKALHEVAEAIHKRSLIIIFSDMFDSAVNDDELFSALQHLKHNKHEVLLFHVIDKQKELEFEFENRPYRFIDMETNEEIKLHPQEIKDTYLKQIAEFKIKLMLKCGQYKIDFIEADINQKFDEVLMPYLTKRKKMI